MSNQKSMLLFIAEWERMKTSWKMDKVRCRDAISDTLSKSWKWNHFKLVATATWAAYDWSLLKGEGAQKNLFFSIQAIDLIGNTTAGNIDELIKNEGKEALKPVRTPP